MKKSPQRRWRDVPKDELDASVSRSGKPKIMTKAERAAAEKAKQNRKLQSRQKALKRRQ